jgi:dTDP-4-dehydrorhamnose 3,5-epimerase
LAPEEQQMIEGVVVKRLEVHPDQRGRLMEILRCDDAVFRKFGQIYMTTVYPGVVKAWHYHKVQEDNFAALVGMVQVALYDPRDGSPTKGEVVVLHAGVHNPVLVHVPPFIYHGFKNVGTEEAIVVNCPTEPYNPQQPDEFRIDPYDNDIPHDWRHRDG